MTFPTRSLWTLILKGEPEIFHTLVAYDSIHILMNILCPQIENV